MLCPYCSEKIQEGAKKCRFCWEKLENIDQQEENANRMWRLEFFRNLFFLGLILYFTSCILAATWMEKQILFVIKSLISIIAIISCGIPRTIKRCHDVWWSGWWTILFILPIVNIVLFLIPWTNGNNKYGPKPN